MITQGDYSRLNQAHNRLEDQLAEMTLVYEKMRSAIIQFSDGYGTWKAHRTFGPGYQDRFFALVGEKELDAMVNALRDPLPVEIELMKAEHEMVEAYWEYREKEVPAGDMSTLDRLTKSEDAYLVLRDKKTKL